MNSKSFMSEVIFARGALIDIIEKISSLAETNLHFVFVAYAILFGAMFVLFSPPDSTPDEINHQTKITRVYLGNLFGINKEIPLPDVEAQYAPFSPWLMMEGHLFTVKEAATTLGRPINCRKEVPGVYDSMSMYSPIVYAPSALVMHVACANSWSFGAYLFSARGLNLVISAILIAIGIAFAGKFKWIIFVVSLLPSTMSQISSISADALLLGESFCLIGILAGVIGRSADPKRVFFVLAVLSLLVSVSKPAYVWIGCLGLLASPQFIRAGVSKKALAVAFAVVPVVSHALYLAYAVKNSMVVPRLSAYELLTYTINHPTHFLETLAAVPFEYPFGTKWNIFETALGKLGWITAPLSSLSYAILGSIVILSPLVGTNYRASAMSALQRIMLIGAALVSIAMVAFPLYVLTGIGNKVTFGLQGRYYLPTIALILLAFRLNTNRLVSSIIVIATLLALPPIYFEGLIRLLLSVYAY